ncbi:MAG: hypothetical protein H6729_15090 [Deltaproteobacteria bacterium]|nr:hypothetical protein [Deltaproteobacteria bacterium]
MHEKQRESEKLMREILGSEYLELRVEHSVLEEDLLEARSKIQAIVAPDPESTATTKMARRTVEGQGVGIVDAFFQGLVDQFSKEYPSLATIRFAGFNVKAVLEEGKYNRGSRSDALGEVRLLVENDQGKTFEFVATSRSVTGAALQATLDAVEYFVNSERAFLATHHALDDAKARSRNDLVIHFSKRLAELVQNTSYSELIEARRGRA